MTTGNKINLARKKQNLTQEQLAELMGVTRQSVSRWESDIAYPEMEKIVLLAKTLDVSCDYLLRDDILNEQPVINNISTSKRFHYEYKSNKQVLGIPLVHINVGSGFYKAKGFISVGMISSGFISVGLLSWGLLSFGLLSLGLISLAVWSLGILSLGAISVGIISIGAISIGVFSIGAFSLGLFSVGGLSIAKYVAVGDETIGMISFGHTSAKGQIFEGLKGDSINKESINSLIDNNIPSFWYIFKEWIKAFIRV